MKTNRAIALSVATLALAATSAFADGSASTSTQSTSSVLQNATKNLRADYTGSFYGPGIDDPTLREFAPNGSDPDTSHIPTFLRSRVRGGVQLTDQIRARAAVEWDTFMVPQQVNGRDVRSKLRDPFIQISHADMFSAGNFHVAGDFRAYAPGKNVSREQDMLTALRAGVSTHLDIPSSRFGLSADAYAKTWIYGTSDQFDAKGRKRQDLEAYLGPQLEYTINPSLKAVVLYEMEGNHFRGAGNGVNGYGNDYTDLEPGVSWDITKNVNLNPFLNLTTGGQINARTTSIGAVLSVNLL